MRIKIKIKCSECPLTLAKTSFARFSMRRDGTSHRRPSGLFIFVVGRLGASGFRGEETSKEFVEPAHRGTAGRVGCGCLCFSLPFFRLCWL